MNGPLDVVLGTQAVQIGMWDDFGFTGDATSLWSIYVYHAVLGWRLKSGAVTRMTLIAHCPRYDVNTPRLSFRFLIRIASELDIQYSPHISCALRGSIHDWS